MSVAAQFQDRHEAGKLLASKLEQYSSDFSTLVLAISPDAVPVAFEVANALGASLDLLLTKRIVAPDFEEIIIGAASAAGEWILDHDALQQLGIAESHAERIAKRCQEELQLLEKKYRGTHPPEQIEGRKILLVDEGLNIGIAMRTAAKAVRQRHPNAITIAIPVGSSDACRQLENEVDEIICPMTPEPLYSVGAWYADFIPTSDEEISRLLASASSSPLRIHGHESNGVQT